MNNFEIHFLHPWLLLLIIPIAAVILFPFLRLPRKKRKTVKKIVPVVLHILVCLLLLLMLSGISFIVGEDKQSVMLILDLSDSTKDMQEEMITFANRFLENADRDTEVGVLSFAGDSVYEVKLDENGKTVTGAKVNAEATSITSALETAVSLLPSDTNRRIVLLSDGKETDGNAALTASNLAKQGIRIDTVYFETGYLDEKELQISDFTLPSDAYSGDALTATVSLDSNLATDAVLTLYDNGEEIATAYIEIQKGSNTYSFDIHAGESGIHTYNVSVEAEDDTMNVNNQMYAYTNVAGASGVLIVTSDTDNTKALQSLLSSEYDLTVVNAINAPDTLIELCNYDEVILMNVNAEELPSSFGENLSVYVHDYGRSVLTVGGKNTYMYGGMEGTIYEEMMPVSLSLTENANGGSVALMLVLDCSMSMSQQSTYLSIAKQGAIRSVEAMSENDYVGVISFNRSAYLKSTLIQATESNKESLSRIISGLTTSQGTYYTEALELAHEELMASSAETKHVVFLSDGEPSDYGYDSAVADMREDGITVSTIALGYSSSVLSSLAETGGGRYYAVTSTSDLPDIMLSETEQVSVSSLIEESVTPRIASESELTNGISGVLPALYGYLGVTLKEDAECILETENGNPIYAKWQYGIGTVASFMSDLEGKWSSAWLSDQKGKTLTARMVETILSDTHKDSSLSAEITSGGLTATMKLTLPNATANQTVKATIASPDGSTKEYTLTEINSGIFEGTVETPDTGVYTVMFIQYNENDAMVDYLETAFAVSYSKEYDAFQDNGEELMMTMCSFSDGIISTDVDELCQVEMDPMILVKNPFTFLGVLAALLILIDFIIRLVRFKDILNFYKRIFVS